MGKTHDDDEVEIDLRELFYALKKHILIILAALLVGAVIAGAATKIFITPVYSATSTMLVLTKETTLSSLADLQIGSQLTKDYNILITSRTVLQDVVDELNLDMDIQSFERMYHSRQSDVIHESFQSQQQVQTRRWQKRLLIHWRRHHLILSEIRWK